MSRMSITKTKKNTYRASLLTLAFSYIGLASIIYDDI